MDSSSSDEPIKYAPNRLGIALIPAGVIGLVLSVYAIYAIGHWQGGWAYIAIFVFFLQHCLCAFCAKPYFGSDYSASNLGLNLFRSREILHDGQYGARDVREPICTVSEIKTGWGNPSNGAKAAAWKSTCVIVASAANDGGTNACLRNRFNRTWAAESVAPDDFLKRPQPDPTVRIGINDQAADHLGVV